MLKSARNFLIICGLAAITSFVLLLVVWLQPPVGEATAAPKLFASSFTKGLTSVGESFASVGEGLSESFSSVSKAIGEWVNPTSSTLTRPVAESPEPKKVAYATPSPEPEPEVLGVSDEDFSTLNSRVGRLEGQIGTVLQPAASLTYTTSVNLIRNSSFEQASSGNPSQWNYQLDSNSGNTYRSAEAYRTGSYGLKFKGGGTGNFGISQPLAKTFPRRAYVLSLYIKPVNATSATLKLGFWDEVNNRRAKMKDFALSGTKEWSRIEMKIDNTGGWEGDKWFPMIEVLGLGSGNLYIDDVQLEEGTNSSFYHYAGGGALQDTSSVLADGGVLIGTDGSIYPGVDDTGSLGTSTSQFKELRLKNATIDENGGLTVTSIGSSGDISMNGHVTLGDDSGDDINVKGRFISNLVPDADNTYDLGESSLEWKDIYIDGTGYIDGISLQNAETITNSTDDIIVFTGTGGTDNTDLYLDLDGARPVLYSNTDTAIEFQDTGIWTLAAGGYVQLDAATTDNTGTTGVLDLNVDATNTQAGIDIALGTVTDSGVDTVSGIKVTATQSSTDDDVVYGIQVANLGGTADSGNEYAIYQAGTAWDYGLVTEDDILFSMPATGIVVIDAATYNNTNTAGVLDINLDAAPSAAGGTQEAINIDVETIADSADVDTISGIKVTATQTSTDNDVLYGIQVAELAGTADAGNEYAIYQAGTAWDYGLYVEDDSYFARSVQVELGGVTVKDSDDTINTPGFAIEDSSDTVKFTAAISNSTGIPYLLANAEDLYIGNVANTNVLVIDTEGFSTFTDTLTDATAENALTLNVTAQDTTSGTTDQYGLYIDNVASTEGADALVVIDNSDTDDAVGDGIRFVDAGGGITTGIDFDYDGSSSIAYLEFGAGNDGVIYYDDAIYTDADSATENGLLIDMNTDGNLFVVEADDGTGTYQMLFGATFNDIDNTTDNRNTLVFGIIETAGTADDIFLVDETGAIFSDTAGATGADLAEWMNSDQNLAPGTVVVTHPDKKGYVVRSEQEYDSRVVGVVSDPDQTLSDIRPGFLMGSGKGDIPIALAGRVMAKFDSQNGGAYPGDPLTTAPDGKLMRALKAGPTVGKALGYDSNGYVLMLVNIGWFDPAEVTLVELNAVSERVAVMEALTTDAEDVLGEDGDLHVLSEFEGLQAGTLTVTTAADFEGELTVLADATFKGKLYLENGVEVKGDLVIDGAIVSEFTAGEKLDSGDVVYVSGDNRVNKASAASEGSLPAVGIVASSAGEGDSVKVAIAGTVKGLSGLVTGRRYFVGVAGGSMTTNAPSEVGQVVQAIGVARSETQFLVMPGLNYEVVQGTQEDQDTSEVAGTDSSDGGTEPEPTPTPTPTPTPSPEPSPEPVSEATPAATLEE